jgi:hypothetical protein
MLHLPSIVHVISCSVTSKVDNHDWKAHRIFWKHVLLVPAKQKTQYMILNHEFYIYLINTAIDRHVIETSSEPFRKNCVENRIENGVEVVKDTFKY